MSDHLSVNQSICLLVVLYVNVCQNWSDNQTYQFLSSGSCITAPSHQPNYNHLLAIKKCKGLTNGWIDGQTN